MLKTGLPLDVTDQSELGEDRGQTVEVLADEQDLEVLLGDPGRRLGEAIEHLGKDVFEELAGGLADVARPLLGTTVVAAEVNHTAENRLLETTFELVLVTLEPLLLLGDERQLRLGLRRAFLAGKHLLGKVDLDGLAVDGIVQGRRPEEALGLGLAAGAVLAYRSLVFLAGRGELELNGDIARDQFSSVQMKSRLEDLHPLEDMARLRLPELGDRLGVDALDVPGFRMDLGALDFPVVLGRGGDAVAVVAQADLVGLDERLRRLLDGRQLRIGIDGRVEGRGDVLGGPVDALDELEQADGLADRGRQRMVDFLGDCGDLAPDFAVDVRLDEVINLGDGGELSDRLIGEIDRRVDQELLGELDDRPVRARRHACWPLPGSGGLRRPG